MSRQIIKRIFFSMAIFSILLTAGCGFHLRQAAPIPTALHQLTLDSFAPYSNLTRDIRAALIANNVTIVPDSSAANATASLRIISSSFNKSTISLYQDGTAAQYQVLLQVKLNLLYQNKSYPINLTVYHNFLSNPSQPMADSSEQTFLQDEMNTLAAQQLVTQLGQLQLDNHAAQAKK